MLARSSDVVARRLAILAIVARLHPVAACIELHDCLATIIWAMPEIFNEPSDIEQRLVSRP